MPTYKVTDPGTGKTLRLTGDSPPTEQELEQIFSSSSSQMTPTPARSADRPSGTGLSGMGKILPTFISGQTPAPGERTLLGNIFERPAAASREAIRANPALKMTGPLAGLVASTGIAGAGAKTAMTQASLFPEKSETFQNEFIRKAQTSTNPVVNFVKGLVPSAKGLGADMLTSPADALVNMLSLGSTSSVKNAARAKNIQKSNKLVDTSIMKAVKPSIQGKKTFSQVDKFKNQARSAVNTIVDNKNSLEFVDDSGRMVNRLPESLDEFSQGISQTKKTVYNEYNGLIQQANKNKDLVDLNVISDQLTPVLSNKSLKIKEPGVIEYAEKLQGRLKEAGRIDVSEADDLIKLFNEDLKAYYRNPTPDQASKVYVDALLTNNLRKQLDMIMEKSVGQGFQSIKNKYGALRAIEEDVSRSALNHAKKNVKGLVDFSDIFSGGQVVKGLLTNDPASVLQGVAQKGIAGFMKALTNPDRSIKNMFKAVEKQRAIKNPLLKLFPVMGTVPQSQEALSGGN